MTTSSSPDQTLARDDHKRLIKWGIAGVVILFVLVCLFIDGNPLVAYPVWFILMFVGPLACGFAGYGIYWLIARACGKRI